jgi:UDP-N-acetylglucosamine acyltransferase
VTLPRIDPSSRVADGARLADDVEIGPFCTVGPAVQLHAGVRLVSHVNVTGVTAIGERTVIHPFASLGTPPQSNAYGGGPTRLTIGADCKIREGVTVNTGTENSRGITTVGDRCFLMANSHVAHDCDVGNDVIFANGAVLGGHVVVADHVFVGGNTAVHQHCRIGEGAMLGGMSGITRDVIPFGFAFGPKAVLVGLNTIGLKRRKFTRSDLHRIRGAYQTLFLGDGVFAERFNKIAADYSGDAVIGKIVAFIQAAKNRPLMMPKANDDAAGADAAP